MWIASYLDTYPPTAKNQCIVAMQGKALSYTLEGVNISIIEIEVVPCKDAWLLKTTTD